MSRKLSLIVTGAALATTVWALSALWLSGVRRHTLEEREQMIVGRRSAVEAAVRRAEARVEAAEATLAGVSARERSARLSGSAPDEAAATATTRPKGDSRQAGPHDIARLIEQTRKNPAVQRAEDEGYDVEIHWMYAGLFRQLGLSEEQSRRFVAQLQRRTIQHRDLLLAAQTLGISFYDPAVMQLNEASQQEFLAAQRTLLGERGVQELQRYDESMTARHVAMGFAGMATVEKMPLTLPQLEQLTSIIERATQPPPPGPFPRRTNVDWARVDVEVKAVLTEAQAALFKAAEGPGMGRGGSRSVTKMNHAIMSANHADITRGVVRPQPQPE